MPFTVATPIPLYAGLTGLTICISEPGSAGRLNGDADDTMADNDADGLFVATIAEDLIGTFTYVIRRSGTPIQSGWFVRDVDRENVLLDDPRVDLLTNGVDVRSIGGQSTNEFFATRLKAFIGTDDNTTNVPSVEDLPTKNDPLVAF